MADGHLDAFGLVVSDLARAVRFYRLLGVPFPEGAEDSEHGHAEAKLQGGVRLMLDSEASIGSFDPSWRRGDGQAGASLAIHCDSPAAVDELYSRAIAMGARPQKEPWNAFWGQRYAQLRDPDGNPLDLYAEVSTEPSG